MNSQEFVKIVKDVVRDSAINDIISVTENPPGRKPSQHLKTRSEWYKTLSDEQKEIVRAIVSDSVDTALFGLLCVIDGVRAIDDSPEKGTLELFYSKGEAQLLNPPDGLMLHDLYNAKT